MKKFKLEKGFVNRLTDITGRSIGQTQFLFELCDFNLNKLIELEIKIKTNLICYCPGDREGRDRILSLKNGNYKFKLNWLMCKPLVRIKDIPQLSGLISMELEEDRCRCCWNRKYKSQWGIHWNKKELTKWIQNKGGLPHFWNDKDSFEISIFEISKDDLIWFDEKTIFEFNETGENIPNFWK